MHLKKIESFGIETIRNQDGSVNLWSNNKIIRAFNSTFSFTLRRFRYVEVIRKRTQVVSKI